MSETVGSGAVAPSGPVDLDDDEIPAGNHGPQGSMKALAVGAIGVVFGDIGTSPLYALKETFVGHHPLVVDPTNIYGVISLVFWTMIVIVTIKYVFIVMRADNKGEGGSLALLALITRSSEGRKWTASLVMLGVFATALFYGDSIITPAISVLSAVEGLTIVNPGFGPYVIPVSLVILVFLFLIQARGTDRVGRMFGPIMLVYFAVLAVLGVVSILKSPEVLVALSPHWIAGFVVRDPVLAFLALSSVVLSITGAEALYADMGHFGRRPIVYAWLYLVFPCLILNYLGQAGLLLRDPSAAVNPFFLLADEGLRLPLVILATMATVIASQAVITGAYSVTQQAIQLGFMPRMSIKHTSESAAGQIYVPTINWALLVSVVLLVLMFRTSSNLAAAYGLAVTGTMFITALMIGVLATRIWKWGRIAAVALMLPFLAIDGLYLASNATKIPNGGWFPLVAGFVIFTLLTTWSRGRALMRTNMEEGAIPMEVFAKSAHSSAARVAGTAIFMASAKAGVPSALLHNIKHNKVLHERVVILTVSIQDVPYVDEEKRFKVTDMGRGFYRLIIRYGFLEETDVPAALKRVSLCGAPFEMMKTSFFLSRQTLIASDKPGMWIWREKLFAWMLRNAASAMEFFRLPTNRVVELGSQVEI